MKASEARAYVEAAWEFPREWVRDLDSYGTDQFNVALYFEEQEVKYRSNAYFARWQEDNTQDGNLKVWLAAYDFTVARERQIAEIEEEIR
jgi:hypothetical protein